VVVQSDLSSATLASTVGNVNISAGNDINLDCDDLVVNNKAGYTGDFVVDGQHLWYKNGILYDVT